jgi:predicted RNA-binding protein with PIN domain
MLALKPYLCTWALVDSNPWSSVSETEQKKRVENHRNFCILASTSDAEIEKIFANFQRDTRPLVSQSISAQEFKVLTTSSGAQKFSSEQIQKWNSFLTQWWNKIIKKQLLTKIYFFSSPRLKLQNCPVIYFIYFRWTKCYITFLHSQSPTYIPT